MLILGLSEGGEGVHGIALSEYISQENHFSFTVINWQTDMASYRVDAEMVIFEYMI